MKKQLFSVVAALTFSAVVAQTPSPSWSITENGSFSITSAGVRYLDAVDQNVVWLIGYDGTAPNMNYNWFATTSNGGTSYTSGNVFSDTITYQIGNIEGINSTTAWVSAFNKITKNKGVIYQTTNGGLNWTDMTPSAMFTSTASFADVVSFLTPNNGIALGDPVAGEFELWTTSNGGANWTQVPGANIPNPLASEYGIINLYDKQGTTNMWFGTNKGRIYYSTNSGQNWNVTALTAPSNATVTEIAFASATNGLAYVAVGPSTAPVIQAYSTTDGGVTWNLTTSNDPDMGKNDICGIPGTNYFVSAGADAQTGNTVISLSTDNGYSWDNYGGSGIQYLTVDFVDIQHGWAGSFADFTTVGVGGIFKYVGVTSDFHIPATVCLSGGTATVIPTNLSQGTSLTYLWSSPQNSVLFSSTTASAPMITFPGTGTFDIILNATDNNGVTIADTVIVKVVNNCSTPGMSFGNSFPASVCNNSQFVLNIVGSGLPLPTYSISTSATSGVTVSPSVSGPGTSTVVMRFANPGTYTVTYTASNSYTMVTNTRTINILDCTPFASFEIDTISVASPTVYTPVSFICTSGTAETNSVLARNTSTGSGVAYAWSISPNNVGAALTPAATNNSRKVTFYPSTGIGVYTITLVASNGSGTTTATGVIEVQSCITGIQQQNLLLANLNVYPNPAHEQLNVMLPSTSETYKIRMINLLGSVVYEEQTLKNSNGSVTISVVNKPKGVYFLSVESGTAKAVKKIVVE